MIPSSDDIRLPLIAQNNRIPAMFRPDLTTNSYKYFWFLALLDTVREMEFFDLKLEEIAHRMILRAWYPRVYFKLNFGKVDQLAEAVQLVQEHCDLSDDATQAKILATLQSSKLDFRVSKAVKDLVRYVPTRILTPWFEDQLTGLADHKKAERIRELSKHQAMSELEAPLYYFKDLDTIRLTWDWFGYLRDHNAILLDYTYWRLAEFLQKRNPNVPNVATKLLPVPDKREQGKLRAPFRAFLNAHPDIHCIYSGLPLEHFAVDHFLPWSYVAHDLVWNLAPVSAAANTQKRNQLPESSLLAPFCALQHRFFGFVMSDQAAKEHKHRILEEYCFLLNRDPKEISLWDSQTFQAALGDRLIPLLTQARHQGFPGPWQYKP